MTHYSFDDFLNAVKYLDYQDIEITANADLVQLSRSTAKMGKKEVQLLTSKLEGFEYFMHTGKRPQNLFDGEFQKIKPVCENLVAKKQMNKKVLELFKK